MTKDEAIDREAEWKLFKAQMIRDHGSHVFKRDALGETDNMAWDDAFAGWLAAKRSIAQPAADPAPVPAQTGTIDTPEFRLDLSRYNQGHMTEKDFIAIIDARLNAATTETPCKKN